MREIIQFKGFNFDEIEKLVGGDTGRGRQAGEVVVATPQGPLYFKDGDWIIQNPDGTFRVSPEMS